MRQSSSCALVCPAACRHPAWHRSAQVALGERRGAEVRQPSQESARFFILGNKVRVRGLLRVNIDRSAKELRHCPKIFFFFFYSSRFDLLQAACPVQKERLAGVGRGDGCKSAEDSSDMF